LLPITTCSARFGEALESAIVAAVGGAFGGEIRRAGKGQKLVAEVELRGGGFTASQVEPVVLGLEGIIGGLDFIER
jgi:hypothetical protein